jgi:hypothetical protein
VLRSEHKVLRETRTYPMPRTVFLDVVDPSMPLDAQEKLHAKLDELRAFDQLRPSMWKRVMCTFSPSRGNTVLDDHSAALDCASSACGMLEVCAIGCDGCFCTC